MAIPLRVLIIEDSDDDAVLIAHHIERAGYDLTYRRVETKTAMMDAIKNQTWDLIISDYKPPGFNGLTAIKTYREMGLDIPFIIVSGAIGEDLAVEAIISGAHDCVMKNNLSRLLPSIQRGLRKAESKRAHKKVEDALSESESRYRNIFENAIEGIFQTIPEGRFITVNPAMARIHGFSSPEEMVKGITNIGQQLYVNPEDRERYRAILEEKGEVKGFEARVYKKDGSIIWTSTNAKVIRDETGKIINFIGFVEDITERKNTEMMLKEEKEKFSMLIDNAPFGMALIDKEGRFLYVNPKFIEIFGYDLSDLPDGRTWFKKAYPDPEYRHMVIEAWIRDMEKAKTGEQRPRTFNVSCKDGTEKIISFVPVQLESGLQIVSFEDITNHIKAQENLEQAMKRLRKSLIGTIQIISMIIEVRDPYTSGHQKRVSVLARTIAQELRLPNDTVESIRMAGLIHDIGKISVPAEILNRPGILSEIEMTLIRMHPEIGYDMLKDADLPYPIAEIVMQHHERLDGSGYPKGLKGDEILAEAKILAVADVVEAISSHRPYRPALGIEAALDEIEKNKGKLYDEKVVNACIKLYSENGFKFE